MGKFKRAVIGTAARVLFYPTLLYNILRHKLQADKFRWWDQIDQFLLMGAVPFPKHVQQLHRLGVGGVITLNEPFETLVSPSLYKAYGIDQVIIPTMDYLYAPSLMDISRAVEFIHRNASSGITTYVHCKAGRGRSTTVILCYLVKYKNSTPEAAFAHIRSIRPRVLLHPSQLRVVQEFSKREFKDPILQNLEGSLQEDVGAGKTANAIGYFACETALKDAGTTPLYIA